MDNSSLATRMKDYESVSKTRLTRRTPVIIRIDGKAFHTFTKGMRRPFDYVLAETMRETTKYLCENIQGCVLGYTQSDEISLVLVDYKTLGTSAWFDNEVQKICSISASMATMAFNKFFRIYAEHFIQDCATQYEMDGSFGPGSPECKLCKVYDAAIKKGAMFDAKCFNLPKEEVANYIYWRQLDAIRNSIQAVGQANFSQTHLNLKSCNDIKDMLKQKGISWEDFPTGLRRGSCVIKSDNPIDIVVNVGDRKIITHRKLWYVDRKIPVFKGDGREYIERLIRFDE